MGGGMTAAGGPAEDNVETFRALFFELDTHRVHCF